MKIQKQGRQECILASYAILLDKPLDEVREVAKAVAGDLWGQPAPRSMDEAVAYATMTRISGSRDWMWTLDRIDELAGAKGVWMYFEHIRKALGLWWLHTDHMSSKIPTTDEMTVSSASFMGPDLKGRGLVEFRYKSGSHIAAFEDGKVYDSDGPDVPLTWAEFLEWRRKTGKSFVMGWIVHREPVHLGAGIRYLEGEGHD